MPRRGSGSPVRRPRVTSPPPCPTTASASGIAGISRAWQRPCPGDSAVAIGVNRDPGDAKSQTVSAQSNPYGRFARPPARPEMAWHAAARVDTNPLAVCLRDRSPTGDVRDGRSKLDCIEVATDWWTVESAAHAAVPKRPTP